MRIMQRVGFGVIALWAVWSGCGAGAAEVVTAPGITESFLDVNLSSGVAGIVSVRNFEEGQTVEKGRVILELDKKLEELETTRRKLASELKLADLEATRVLFAKTTGVPKEEVYKKEVDYKVSVVEHEMAVEQVQRRQILAPFSGSIAELALDVGEACEPYQPLVRLVDTKRCYFISNIEAKTAAQLRLDQEVTVEIETGSSPVRVPAKIVYLSPVVDPSSGLLKVKALFDNSQAKIRPGLAGHIQFPTHAN